MSSTYGKRIACTHIGGNIVLTDFSIASWGNRTATSGGICADALIATIAGFQRFET